MSGSIRRIPLADLSKGIQIALAKALEKLSDAETLILKGSSENAVILIQFAIEEFGKAVYLKEKLENGIEDIEEKIFRSHPYKEQIAWTKIPKELKTIYMGTFSPLAFSVQNFSSDETISHEARISATFIDWVDNKWRIGIKTDAGKLLQLVQGLREEIKVFKIP